MKNQDLEKRKKLVKAWIDKGKDDLLFAKAAFKETQFYDHICCLCQQAVEKYLKALIIILKGEIRKKDKIHNLNILAERVKPLVDLSKFEKELRMLSQAYIPARYPDEICFKAFTKKEAKEAIEMAQKIIDFIERKILEDYLKK